MKLSVVDREKHILDLFAKGDPRAMKSLYNGYADLLAGVCYRYVCDDALVKDILQDSFIQIFSNISKFEYRGKGSLRAWMTRIVINRSLQELRRIAASPETGTVIAASLGTGTVIAADFQEDPDGTGFRDGLTAEAEAVAEPEIDDLSMDEIMAMISRLPEGYRTVFNMYVFDGMSHKEIAETLGIKENTSASQFHKARRMLAKMIGEYRNR